MDLKTIKFPLKKKSSYDSTQNLEKSSTEIATEETTKSRFTTNLSNIDLDPLKVKDSMGRLSGKMKHSLNKISDKIPIPKISNSGGATGGVDEFDQAIINIESDTQQQQPQLQEYNDNNIQHEIDLDEQQHQTKHSSKNMIHTISNVKGKLNKFGKVAKQRLSNLQPSNSLHEDNDSAHSNASKDSNPSLTAIARLSRTIPSAFQSSNVDNSTGKSSQTTSTPHTPPSISNNEPKSPSAILAEELLELSVENENENENEGNSFPKLSRRPSEYLEFENVTTTSAPNSPPESGSVTSPTPSSGNESASGVVSHTPFLHQKVKKLNFLKTPSPSSSTPPLEANNDQSLEDNDPYYQPYGNHHHPASLSKLFLSNALTFLPFLYVRWCKALGRKENTK